MTTTYNISTNDRLALVVLAAVTVAAINHDEGRKLALFKSLNRLLDRFSVVVGSALATTKNNVASIVAFSLHNGRQTLLGDGQEMMASACGLDSIHSDGNATIGTVLETDWAGQARCQLTMYL